jgi:putative DNA primase/helicase
MDSVLGLDHEQLRAFLELQHKLAAPYAPEKPGDRPRGLLMLSRAEVHPNTSKDDTWVNVRIVPGDLENSLLEAGLAEGRDNVNVYFSWHVLRPDLPARVRGGTEDVIAKLALVADFDYGPSHTDGNNFDTETWTIPGLSVAPSAVIETSPGNYQAIFVFDAAVSPKHAAPLAEMLWKVAQCDPATKVMAQPWRVPGTVNYPNHKKIKEGRTPVLARWVKPWNGSTVSYATMKEALASAVAALDDDDEDDEGEEEGAGGPDPLAEAELGKHANKVRTAGDNKNSQVFNSGKRLGRFIGSGRLDEARVVELIHEAIRSWGDPTEPERKAAGTLQRGIEAGKKLPPLKQPSGAKGAQVDDNHLAEHFIAKYKDKVRFVKKWGRWLLWTGTHWKHDERNTVFDAIRRTNLELAVRSVSKANNTEAFASAFQNVSVEVGIWDRDPYLLGTPGGTVDLKTGKLRPADPGDYITKLTSVTPADVADETTCPRWLSFLAEVTSGNSDLIRFLKQWYGYSLTGDTTEQCLIFIYGPGGNGKGVLASTIQAIVGDYGHEAATDVFLASYYDKHTTSLAALHGKRLVFASETEEGRTWAIGIIKRLTGGDSITARFMREDDFTFNPVLKLTVTGNHQPNLLSVSIAERRRFNLVSFVFVPEKVDPYLVETLKKEGPGILRWMIDGCLDWLENRLVRPESVKRDTDEYLDRQDNFNNWREECTELYPGTTIGEPSGKLFDSWRAYAEARNLRVGRESELIEKLVKLCGCRPTNHLKISGFDGKIRQVRGLEGIKLLVEPIKKFADEPWGH